MLDKIIDGTFALAVVYLAYRLRENTIHINSRMTDLIKKVEEAAVARGNLEGRAEAKEEAGVKKEAYWKGERKQDEIQE